MFGETGVTVGWVELVGLFPQAEIKTNTMIKIIEKTPKI